VRKARAVVKIPAEFIELDKPITVKPDDVAEAFVKANPGLSRAAFAFAVACDSKRLSEVRACLNKDFFTSAIAPRWRAAPANAMRSRCRRCVADERRLNTDP
jgi:ribonuclease T2